MSQSSAPMNSIAARADALRMAAASPSGFSCSWTLGGLDAGWVHLAGELDASTSSQLDRTLREPRLQTHLVVLDLRNLRFMDSSGVHIIVGASIRARKAGRRLVLVNGSPNVIDMFTLTGSAGDVEIAEISAVRAPAELML
jgi:anti-anti-sigma factor